MPDDGITHMHQMAKSLPSGLILPNCKHIDDVLDNEFNSIISDKGIPGVNDNNTNTNADIKYKTTTKSSVKFDDNNKLHELPDLENIMRTINDSDDDDDDDNMPGV